MRPYGVVVAAIALLALPIAPVGASVIIDGQVSPAGEWTGATVVLSPEDPAVNDAWDITAFALLNDGGVCLRWDVVGVPGEYSSGGTVMYECAFTLAGGGAPFLYATNLPVLTTRNDHTEFYMESNSAAAVVNVGAMAIGSVVEAKVPLAALAELGVVIPPGGLDVTFTAYIVDNTTAKDDVVTGSFTITPEPATLMLLAAGGGMSWVLAYARRRRTQM